LGQTLQRESAIPQLLWQSIRAAELSGNVAGVLQELAEYYETEAIQEAQVSSTLFYPKVLLFFTAMIATFIVVFLLPSYLQVYTANNVQLPEATRILLAIYDFMSNYWYVVIPGLLLCLVLFQFSWRRLRVHPIWERAELRLPLYGDYLRERMLAHVCRALATMLSVGIPLDRALHSCENLPEKKLWRDAIRYAYSQVSMGGNFAEAMKETGCFPESFIQLLSIGSAGSDLTAVLPKAAAYYSRQAKGRGEKLLTLLQPTAMVGASLIIGALALALLLPLYSQMDVLQNIQGVR